MVMSWSSTSRVLHVAAISTALALTAACGSNAAVTPVTTTTPPANVQPHGTATNLDAIIDEEAAVYDVPKPGRDHDDVEPDLTQRKWTLLLGTKVKAFCQVIFPEVKPYSSGIYVSWVPDQYGYVADSAVEITTRTPDTNERIRTSALKPC